MLYDAHNHLQDAWLTPHRAQVFADLARLPLARAVVNGTCQSDWIDVTQLADAHAYVLPSYGLHPWNVGNATPTWRAELEHIVTNAAERSKNIALGEIGLDRWILDRARPDDPRLAGLRRAPLTEQIDAFVWQLELAAKRNLPVTIHCLDAWGALTEALRACRIPARGFLLHAYGGSIELARDFIERGAYFSFNGYFLGERQVAKRTVFASLPLDRVLVETDAPAMPPPENYRRYSLSGSADGNPINHPGNIAAIYEGFATLRGVSLDTLSRQVAINFRHLFETSQTK